MQKKFTLSVSCVNETVHNSRVILRAHAEVGLLVSPSNHSGFCCMLPLSISYAVTGLVIVVYTLRGDLLCNRLSENSPVLFDVCEFQNFLYLTRKVLLSS